MRQRFYPIVLVLMLCTFFWRSSTADVASPRPIVIAVVSIKDLFDRSPQSLAAQDALRQSFKAQEQRVTEGQAEIDQLKQTLDAEFPSLSEEDKLQRQRDLRSKQRSLERFMEDYKEEVRNKRDAATVKVQEAIFAAIDRVREQKNIDVVLRENDYISADKRVDITPSVLEYLQDEFKNKGAVSFTP